MHQGYRARPREGGGGQGDFRGRRANSEGQRSPARKGGSEEHSQKIADKGGMSEGRLMHIPVCDVPREQGATGGGGEQVEAQWAGGSRGRMATH